MQDFIVHACEQVLRFSQVDLWEDLSDERKLQLWFNMWVVALGLKLSKQEGYMNFSDLQKWNISTKTFRDNMRSIIESKDIPVQETQIQRPF